MCNYKYIKQTAAVLLYSNNFYYMRVFGVRNFRICGKLKIEFGKSVSSRSLPKA